MRKLFKILIIFIVIIIVAVPFMMSLNAKFCMGVGIFPTEEAANMALPRYASELGDQYAGSEIKYPYSNEQGPVELFICTYKNR